MRRPFYGVLLAPTFVLAVYGGQHASPADLLRPLLVFTLVAAGAFLLVGSVTRRWHAASFVVTVCLVAVVAVHLVALVFVWPVLAWWNAKHHASWAVTPKLTYPLNAFVAAWFGIATVAAVFVSLPPPSVGTMAVHVNQGPNVYLIWLDAYPRRDTLMEYFGFDNGPFLEALEHRGFTVAERSRAEYPSSIQTMATMLQGRSLEDLIDEEWTGTHEQHRALWHLMNDSPIAAGYEDAGYTTYSIISPAPGHDWRSADVVLDSPWLSDFEAHLLDSGVLRPLLPFWAMHRADILDSFEYLEDAVSESPRFVLAHILKPHDPYVFAADGGPAAPCGGACTNHAGPPNPTLGDRVVGQITWLNGRVLKAVDHIIAVDPSAIVVVFSDHGLRRDPNDMDEWFRTLFASRNRPFPDDVSTTELLITLTSTSVGTGHADR